MNHDKIYSSWQILDGLFTNLLKISEGVNKKFDNDTYGHLISKELITLGHNPGVVGKIFEFQANKIDGSQEYDNLLDIIVIEMIAIDFNDYSKIYYTGEELKEIEEADGFQKTWEDTDGVSAILMSDYRITKVNLIFEDHGSEAVVSSEFTTIELGEPTNM